MLIPIKPFKFLIIPCIFLFVSNAAFSQLKADFTVDQTGGCSPLAVSFTNTTTGASSGVKYKWDFGNGNTSTFVNAGATFFDEKKYTVTLTATDGTTISTKQLEVTVYKKPAVSFSLSDTKGCMPLSVTFTSTSTAGDGSISNYFWDFGDGSTNQGSGLKETIHTYNFVQNPNISLTITNSYGCYNTLEKPKAVEVLTAIKAGFSANKTVLCAAGESVTFSNTSTGPGTLSYEWDFGDNKKATDKNPVHTYDNKGVYTVKLTVKSSDGCTEVYEQKDLINVANYTVDFDVPALICENTNAFFSNTSTAGSSNTLWNIDGNNYYYNYSGINYVFDKPGQHTIKLTQTYGNCDAVKIKIIEVKAAPKLNGFVAEFGSLCGVPVTIQFKDTSKEAIKWLWNFDYNGNNATSTLQNPSYTYTVEGSHYVRLTATNTTGCSAVAEQYYYIAKPYVQIQIVNSTSPTGNTGCPGFDVIFQASSTEDITDYKWEFPDDGTTSTVAKPKHSFTKTGTFDIKLTYTTKNGCKGTTSFNSIYVYKKPEADFSVLNTNICGNTPVQFYDNSIGVATSWTWNFGDGGYWFTSSPAHQYYDEGAFTVTLIAANGSCADTIVKTGYIKVAPPFPKISSLTNTCEGTRGLVTLSQESRGAESWKWDFGDGQSKTLNTDEGTITHNYAATGSYKVVLTTTNGACTVKDSSFAYVLLKQKPVLSSTATDVCASSQLNIKINGLENNPSPYTYYPYNHYYISSIQYGDGSSFNGSSSTQNYSWTTEYTGIISGLDSKEKDLEIILTSVYFGCADTTNIIPLLVKGPAAGFDITNDEVCYKSPVILTDTSKGKNNIAIAKWDWSFGDGQTLSKTTGGIVSHQYASPGTYYPTLTITDADGCTSTTAYYSQYAQVYGPQAAFYPSQQTAAPDETIYFYNNTNNYGSYDAKYKWDFGDGKVSASYSPSHSYDNTGIDTVTLIASSKETGCADTTAQIVYIKNVNTAFTYTTEYINNNSCPPLLARFQNTSLNANYVSWDFGDGGFADDQDFPSHTYYKPGVYKVTLYGYGNNNAKDSTVDSVIVKGPYATLSADVTAGCGTTAIKITADATGATDYTWDFADGTLINTKDTFAAHLYSTPGVYFPALIMKDGDGCSSTFSLKDTIVIDTLSILGIGKIPLLVCDSGYVSFNPSVSSIAADQLNKPLDYHWRFSANAKDTSIIQQPQFYYNKLGKYPFELQVSSSYGCLETFKDTVTVAAIATAVINGPAEICQSADARFTASANITSNVTWNWDFKNGNTSNLQQPLNQQYDSAGNYAISIITLHDGCYDTAYHTLQVHAKPVIDLQPESAKICIDNSIQLIAHDGIKYEWTPNNHINNNTLANPTIDPKTTQQYKVKVTNYHTCVSEDSVTVTVIQRFNVLLDPVSYSCKTVGVQLQASGADIYKWISGETISNINIPDPYINPLTEQTYTVVGYDKDGCFTDTASTVIQIKPLPTINAGADLMLPVGSVITLSAAGSPDITSWNWSPATYLSCTNCPSPVAAPRSAITYTATVANAFGCTAKDSLNIGLVCKASVVKIPTGFTPNNDGNNDWFCVLGKGIKMVKHIAVFGRWGQLLYERNNIQPNDHAAGWNGKYNNAPVAAGTYVYMAEIVCDTDEVFTYKGTITLIR